MIGKTRFPGDIHVIADLEHGARATRTAAVHETQMAAVRARQDLDHRRGLAMGAD
jgi:hypothetical protein